jgi:hypothetical protein
VHRASDLLFRLALRQNDPRVLESLHGAEAHIAREEVILEARSLLIVH